MADEKKKLPPLMKKKKKLPSLSKGKKRRNLLLKKRSLQKQKQKQQKKQVRWDKKTATGDKWLVTADGCLNIHTDPHDEARILGKVQPGEVLKEMDTYQNETWLKHLLGWTRIKSDKGEDYMIQYQKPKKFFAAGMRTESLGIRLIDGKLNRKKSADIAADVKKRASSNWKPVGIKNVGNSCYFNTTMQSLLSSHVFCNTMMSINLETIDNARTRVLNNASGRSEYQVSKRLKELNFFKSLVGGVREYHKKATGRMGVINFDEILNCFRNLYPQFNNACEHDSQESLICFLDALGNLKISNETKETLDKLFRCHFQVERKIHQSSTKRPVKVSFDSSLCLRINVCVETRGKSAMLTTLEDALDYECGWRKSQDRFKLGDKRYQYEERTLLAADGMPEQLIIHLARFRARGRVIDKLAHNFSFPEKLDLSEHTNDKDIENVYILHGVLVHSGRTAESGHYFAYVRNSENPDGQIYNCNDDTIRKTSRFETKDAYILFYVKRKDEDESDSESDSDVKVTRLE